ncbi:Flp family type IVb pilin [Knoellia sp. CPCC 206453]|uniref:Flp family type IVb pilin n=1 Tax=Knoellia pratensis TaxID=3404796 RepID=UPI0036073541
MSEQILRLRKRLASDVGATMVEYGLMVALVAVVVGVAAAVLGTNISTMFNTIATSI